ncbi:MAG: SMP-30/gluconolactonase/LRE family protein [Bryobacteraceae bacterium]
MNPAGIHLAAARVAAPKHMALAIFALLLFAAPCMQGAKLTTVATFDPTQSEIPENIVIDRNNNLYVSLLLSNEVRKITPEGVQSTYATFNGAPGSLTAGLVIDDNTGDLFVAYDPAGQNSVIYVVHPDQSQTVFATFPVGAGLDGMTPDVFGNLYLADAFLGYVWRVSCSGGTPEIWLDMHAPGSLQAPGPNGIKFDLFQQNLYVSVSYQGIIYRIPMKGSSAGTPVVYASNLTPDDFAFDLLGNLYVATEPSMSVVRISPNGTQETIASAADGLENTSAVLFGRNGAAILDLYILSASEPPVATSHPGVYLLDVGLPGFPVSIP